MDGSTGQATMRVPLPSAPRTLALMPCNAAAAQAPEVGRCGTDRARQRDTLRLACAKASLAFDVALCVRRAHPADPAQVIVCPYRVGNDPIRVGTDVDARYLRGLDARRVHRERHRRCDPERNDLDRADIITRATGGR